MSEYFPKNNETDLNDYWTLENEKSSDYDPFNDPDIQVAVRDVAYAGVYWNEVRATAFEDSYDQDSLDLSRETE